MKLWFITYDCADYYCDGMHPVAVCTTNEKAEALQREHERQTLDRYSASRNTYTITEIETDTDLNW